MFYNILFIWLLCSTLFAFITSIISMFVSEPYYNKKYSTTHLFHWWLSPLILLIIIASSLLVYYRSDTDMYKLIISTNFKLFFLRLINYWEF